MFRTDYRVILRRFEFERMLSPQPPGDVNFGGRYGDRLLDAFYATDARKLHRTFPRLNETQQTLYALNTLCGEISNGGIAQFVFNSQPVLLAAAATALGRIGAADVLREYEKVLAPLRADAGLGEIRAAAADWDDYLAFKERLGGEAAAAEAFNEWYFAGGEEVLDQLMRRYLAGREDDVVRFCDGDPRLEARWTRERLGQLVTNFDSYTDSPRYQFFDLLFTPDRREQFGPSGEERREKAREAATGLIPLIRQAVRRPGIASYTATPTPQITIRRPGPGMSRSVTVSFHENQCDLMWSISHWD